MKDSFTSLKLTQKANAGDPDPQPCLPDPDKLVRGTDPDPVSDPSLFALNVLSGLK